MRRALAFVLGVMLAAMPTASTLDLRVSSGRMPCHEELTAIVPCHQPAAITCCQSDQRTPSRAPTPTTDVPGSRPCGPGALLSPTDAPDIAVASSRGFAAWSGTVILPRSHLILRVFRV